MRPISLLSGAAIMSYGVIVKVAAPIQAYPAMERTGADMSGPAPEVIEFQPEGTMLGHAFA